MGVEEMDEDDRPSLGSMDWARFLAYYAYNDFKYAMEKLGRRWRRLKLALGRLS